MFLAMADSEPLPFVWEEVRQAQGLFAILRIDAMQLAKEAYEAYANHTGWKSLATGQPLPQWDKLSEAIQQAWQVSTAWVVGKATGMHDWQIANKDRAFAERIEKEAMRGDEETDHATADGLLCVLLTDLGCVKTVGTFLSVRKWYA